MLLLAASCVMSPLLAQRPAPYRAKMAPDGHADIGGIWEALGTVNWDLQDHPSQGGPYFQMGSLGAVPSGRGVVEGGSIPYKPDALVKKKENFANRWKLDPEVKCYMPGIPRHLYAVSVSNRTVREGDSDGLQIGRAHV